MGKSPPTHISRDHLPAADLPFALYPLDFRGKRVTVMGLGVFGGGVAVTRYLCRAGARVTVTDLKSAEELADSLRLIADLEVELHLGGHREEDFTRADVVVVNPAVKPTSPYLRLAADAGALIESETNIFFKLCPCPVVGVTGSNGKSTTAKLTAEVLWESGRRVWLGGNIGRPLLEHLPRISPSDLVVMELSSFQLDHLRRIGLGPTVGVVTNLSPNHLEWHGSMEAYAAAKRAAVELSPCRGGEFPPTAVLNADDPAVRRWGRGRGRYFFGLDVRLARREGLPGVFLSPDGGEIIWRGVSGGGEEVLPTRPEEVPIPGRHNLSNVLAALVVGRVVGVEDRAAARMVRCFQPLPDRLEPVLERGGIRFYNDSLATTPESAVCALEALDGPKVLIAGGYDKGVPMEGFAAAIARRVRVLVTTGATGRRLAELVRARRAGDEPTVLYRERFDEAVRAAVEMARPGDVVLLSPGCASYDQFNNYRERARRFRELIGAVSPGGREEDGCRDG